MRRAPAPNPLATLLRGRAVYVAGVALALVFGLRVLRAVAQPGVRPSGFVTRVWDERDPLLGPLRAVALVPRGAREGQRFPLLFALHGLGETGRGVERGAFGWPRDYELGASELALRSPRLDARALLGLVTPARLAELRRTLAERPYRGVVVVAPFTPDVRASLGSERHRAYERYLLERLLPRARAELPVLPGREHTGIDGVSLGGLHALWTGLGHPEHFGAVGSLQAAVRDRQDLVAQRFVAAPDRPSQRVRLVTSDGDALRPDVQQLARALRARGVEHELRVLTGPHDYPFNRGPGGVEMLLFHDRALRGEPSP